MASPYDGVPPEHWEQVTRQLVAQHPLTADLIHDAAMTCWNRLWATRVGDTASSFALADANPPATVIGYFFEKLFALELAARLPGHWRGGTGSEKDLFCISDPTKSVEMKSSGQLGYRVFGNRSYGQQLENTDAAKKDKSGYYITINFFGRVLTLLRFGWIDATDWQAQASATGQMAGLPDAVYNGKLLVIPGDYRLDGPVQLAKGVGGKAAEEFLAHGIFTVRDLLRRTPDSIPRAYLRHLQTARIQYSY